MEWDTPTLDQGGNSLAETGVENRYTYNGKELEDNLGINWHYYGFRMYDPAISRFTGVDPIAEEFAHLSTYNYADNSPIANIDLHGLQAVYSAAASFHSGEGAKFQEENPKTAAAIGAVMIGGPFAFGLAVEAGAAATVSFVANEIKDEVLSQATGGASDVLDVTKMATKGVKELISNFSDLPSSGSIDPSQIKFSQGSIKSEFKDGGSVADLTKGLQDGSINPSDIPAIRLVEKDGSAFTLDNRRLKAFQDAGVDIPYKKLDNIPKSEKFKFKDYNAGKTDGTTIRIRGVN